MTRTQQYLRRKQNLVDDYQSGDVEFRLAKSGMTNLFRYGGNASRPGSGLEVDDFCNVLEIDVDAATIDVEGMTSIEKILQASLPHGLIPKVSPELKHITAGGAIVGIGIESSCFREGFFHDGVIEAEVMLPSGEVVTCSADNEYADLFNALPNSFGTLGYVLRARLQLMPAKKYVRLTNTRYRQIDEYLAGLERHIDNPEGAFLEGLFYGGDEFYLTAGDFVAAAANPMSIYRGAPYYKKTRGAGEFDLLTEDYIFRFDPDWFWNVPDHGVYEGFRQWAPKSLRNSSFYTRYTSVKRAVLGSLGMRKRDEEELIQDWVLPWERSAEFIAYIVENIDIQGQPWVALPIVPASRATLYPLEPGRKYMNIGCYCFVRKPDPKQDYSYTRLLDQKCFDLGGVKMLYSSTFLPQREFDEIYNGESYRLLKKKYDPEARALTLYQKAAAKR